MPYVTAVLLRPRSHDHATQYTFVFQSLSLWLEIMRHMPLLWLYADCDMLNESYRLCDTGQGYHRVTPSTTLLCKHLFFEPPPHHLCVHVLVAALVVQVQQCPMVGRLMRAILNSVQQRCGGRWVVLSVIHLGDRDVPNALVFIDKYTQGTRFVGVSVC